MKSLYIALLSGCLVWVAIVESPVHTQAAPGGARGAAAAPVQGGRRAIPTGAIALVQTPEERQDSRLAALDASIDEIRSELAQLREQLAKGGGAGRAVPLTPENRFPARDDKNDDFNQVTTSIRSLWTTIDLIREDIRRINGRQ